jgi:hypothetical protein
MVNYSFLIVFISCCLSASAYSQNISPGELYISTVLTPVNSATVGVEGPATDRNGNLYIARFGKGLIAVVSPEGRLIREISLIGKKPTNVAFGGKDGCTMYVTLQDMGNIECFQVEKPGREWQMRNK